MTQSQIGRPTPLRDGRSKVTGVTKFTADLDRPGLLHARLVVSLHPHAALRAVRTTAALAVPGAVAVLTAADMPDIPPKTRSRLLLARGRVIFAGQPIALVLAESPAAAEDAARLVEVDYDALPAAVNVDEALAENAPLVWPAGAPGASGDAGAHGASTGGGAAAPRASNIASEESYTRGDAAAGFAQADIVAERTFTTPIVHQSAVEPHSILAEANAHNNGFTVWASTQSPFDVRKEVARVLDLAETEVRIIPMAVGGGFGGKNGLYEPLVAAAARAAGRPVLLTLTRSEEMIAANPAPGVRIRLRLGAKSDGTLTALEGDVVIDDGCYPFGLGGFLAMMLGSFYRVANISLRSLDVLTFKVSAGPYRAPGAPSVIFALDCLLDELSERLGLDPLAMRLMNSARAGDPMLDGEPWPVMGMQAVLEAVRDHPLWRDRALSRARGRAVGMAVGGWPGGTEPAAAACSLHRDGVLQINVGSVDLHGTSTSFAMMAAEVFGVTADQVRVVASDTDTAPFSGGAAGSKITYTTGAAVVAAAQEARRQVLAIAAEELEASVDDLEIVDGGVQVRGAPSRAIKLAKLAGKTMTYSAKHAPVFAQGRIAQLASAPAFSAQLAEVSVDEETGAITVHRLVVVQDVGKAINPLAVEGQMAGGAIQGLGWALYEDLKYDTAGQLLAGTWLDYAIPAFDQAPPLETIILEVPSETGPFGARGVGEAPVIPTAAAVANAVAAAAGVRMSTLPMTPPRVLAALQARAGRD
jgi:CO/xanthine dehydrogenase Mo-binding subunit